ncbi:hypothetical protein DIPPA_18013 [Diplonema papillatum]|nr:hypothetical protein DIPPA_18013 [Diplonema papillatum]
MRTRLSGCLCVAALVCFCVQVNQALVQAPRAGREEPYFAPLHSTAAAGNAFAIRLAAWLDLADLNAKDASGWTPLHWAVENGQVGVVRALCGAGVDPGLADEFGVTPLHLLAAGKLPPAVSLKILQVLSDHSAPLEPEDAFGMRPLHYAALSGTAGLTDALLSLSAKPAPRDADGLTPLHHAVFSDRPDVVHNLLSHPAAPSGYVNFQTSAARTALHYVLHSASESTLAALTAHGAQLPADGPPLHHITTVAYSSDFNNNDSAPVFVPRSSTPARFD